jgi:hypothetical protein
MKISYRPVSGGGYTTLLNTGDGSAILSEFPPAFAVQVQREQLAQSAVSFRNPRGNIEVNLPLNWNVQYASQPAALQAILDLSLALLNTKFHLQIQEGTTTWYLPNAACSDFRPMLKGVSVDFSATFNTDAATATAP